MKKLYLVVCLLTLGVVVGFARLTPARTDSQPTTAISQPSSAQPGDEAQDAKTFVGQITQSNGQYVLKDRASKATFLLDDQEKAKPFEGKNVKIIGTLDAASNTIHVMDIQAA